MNAVPYDEMIAGMYRKDPEYALEMINSVLEDGDAAEFAILIQQLERAFSCEASPRRAELPLSQLFEVFAGKSNRFATVQGAFTALGLHIPATVSSAQIRATA